MILNFKKILFFSLIILGYYYFIQEYENLNIKDLKIIKTNKLFIESKKDSIMASLNNLSEVASVKSIRIEP